MCAVTDDFNRAIVHVPAHRRVQMLLLGDRVAYGVGWSIWSMGRGLREQGLVSPVICSQFLDDVSVVSHIECSSP